MIGLLSRYILKKLMLRPCPNEIPRSGERGKGVSCYSICLKTGDGDLLLLVQGIDKKGFNGLRWTGNQFDEPGSIPFSETQNVTIQIERYIGLFSFTYSSVAQCVLCDWTYLNRVPIMSEGLSQFFFSRRDLGLTKRIEALDALVDESIDNPQYGVTEVSLPSLIHGNRWFFHPDKTRQQNYARFLLDSLAESGELKKYDRGLYRITGKALTTLSLYETEKQRHDQMLSQSRHLKWLTLALIFVGAANAIVTFLVSSGR